MVYLVAPMNNFTTPTWIGLKFKGFTEFTLKIYRGSEFDYPLHLLYEFQHYGQEENRTWCFPEGFYSLLFEIPLIVEKQSSGNNFGIFLIQEYGPCYGNSYNQPSYSNIAGKMFFSI